MITKEVLKELYLKQNKTREQIAKELNVPKSQVNFYCWKYQIRKDIKAQLFEKICPICNKHFIVATADRDRIYCSVHCMRIGSRKVPRKACPNCGKEVIAYYKNKEFCNKKCKKEYQAKQDQIIYKKVCQHCGKEYAYYNAMPNWFAKGQVEGKKYYGIDSSKYCCYNCGVAHRQEVSRKTCLNRYGVEFTAASENNLRKSRETKLKRYGNAYYTNIEKIKLTYINKTKEEKLKILNKVRQTKLERYGNANYNGNKIFTEEQRQQIAIKQYITKKKNNSFIGKGNINGIKCSLSEKYIYDCLSTKYKNIEFEKFITGYGSCDFYIPELDLYIEYQGIWTHGGKPFEGTKEDLAKIKRWVDKNTPYYRQALYTWTKLDIKKRKAAIKLNLNWIEFFNMKAFENWFKNLQ